MLLVPYHDGEHAAREAARIPRRRNRILALRGVEVPERVVPPPHPPKGSRGRKKKIAGAGAGSSSAARSDGRMMKRRVVAFQAPR